MDMNQNMWFNMMFGNQMPNNCMPMNFGGNDNWMMGYNAGMNFPNFQPNMNMNMNNNMGFQMPPPNKVNIVFKTTQGLITNVLVDFGTLVKDALLLYLKRVGRPDLYKENSGIFFLHNAQKVNLNDNTFIENFDRQINPVIIVNDVQNLIGA